MSTPDHTTFRAMGSQFQAWVETDADGAAILAQVPAWVEAYEDRLSRFRPHSELMQLNARAGEWVAVSDDLLDVILAALDAARLTGGLYNPLVLPALLAAGYDRTFEDLAAEAEADDADVPPVADWTRIDVDLTRSEVRLPAGTQIDLGGIAKGWTAERIADRLEAYGPCMVDAGGDLVARGKPTGYPGWPVAVAEPGQQTADDPAQSLLMVSLKDKAIATSGTDYHRWTRGGTLRHHIIDPRTARPAESDVLSATVIDVDAERAEAYAKLLILLGAQAGLAWLAQNTNASAVVACLDGAVLASADFQVHLIPEPAQ